MTNRGKMDNWWARIESSDNLKKFEWMSWIKNTRNTVKEKEKSKWKEKIEKDIWRMEAELWTVISTLAGSSVNPAFSTAAIIPFNFSHYLLCSQTNKLINLQIVQTFQLHSSWIYVCLVNGWWVLCRKHHPNGTTVNTRDRKQTDMFDTLFLNLTLNYSDWNKQITRGKWLITIRMNNTVGCLCNLSLDITAKLLLKLIVCWWCLHHHKQKQDFWHAQPFPEAWMNT